MALNMTTTNATMRAVAWQGNPYSVGVVDLPMPTIINQTDAIVQISRAAICGSDLHIYRGTNEGMPAPFGLGHEGVGYVSEVGAGVGSLKVGDPVIVPFTVDEGHLHTEPTSQMYGGYGNGGDLGGTQAEYLRIPFADNGLIPIPSLDYTNSTTNETVSLANDYVMVSDIFATGWASLDYAGFQPGDTVAVFGAGPVGLMAAYSAMLRGASTVYSVDYVPDRLQLAESIGAIPINFRDADPVDQILALEANGVTRSVDAVGYEQVNRNLTVQSDVIIHNMLAVTSTGGGLGTVGVYNHESGNTDTAPRASTVRTDINFSLSDFFFGEFKWEAGPSDPIGLGPELVRLVASGKARPGFIVSDVINIEDAPEAYARFERHDATKVVIAFVTNITMVLITASTTAPVNPPGANPVLTHDDLWTALVAKARHPEEFVAVIEKSRVIHEDAYGLTRGVTFKGDMGNGGEMEEVIKYFGKMKIDFFVPQTGQSVSNIISASSSSEGQDLYLTFTFEWYHPELQPGSAEAQEIETKRTAMSRQVVPHTVAVARTMKAEGRLY